MDFHLYLANHHPHSLVLMEDLLRPIVAGLEDCGHEVACFTTELVLAPRVNLFVEFFTDEHLVQTLITLKQRLGDKFLFGVVCTEDLEDKTVWQVSRAGRLEGLRRVLPHADFAWTLVNSAPYGELIPSERIAPIEYGFSPRLVPSFQIEDSRERDIDVLIYGSPYTYRMPIFAGLRAEGLASGFTVSVINDPKGQIIQGLPRYLAEELLARAKVIVDMRRAPDVRALSVTRIAAALHSGTAIVAEKFDKGATARFYRYTAPADYDALVETCRRIVREQDYVALGHAARQRFADETSMRDNMAAALRLPVFERLARG